MSDDTVPIGLPQNEKLPAPPEQAGCCGKEQTRRQAPRTIKKVIVPNRIFVEQADATTNNRRPFVTCVPGKTNLRGKVMIGLINPRPQVF